jgi:hydroxymethylpyrimidine pyrophosphatase-like HAD family hydrolase
MLVSGISRIGKGIDLQKFTAILATDLDGTLLCSKGQCSSLNRQILENLAEAPVMRVVATGRSLFSVQKTLDPQFPLDVLVFSSGAGIWDWKRGGLMHHHPMSQREATQVADALISSRLSFMAHAPIPDNHRFWFFENQICPPDFARRCEMHGDLAKPWEGSFSEKGATQFIVMTATATAGVDFEKLVGMLPEQSIVRATSPWNPEVTWLEIFPKGVTKGHALLWLQKQFASETPRTFALGNDYNDIELLDWAQHRRVVGNAPPELLQKYDSVVNNESDGFYHAVTDWLESSGLSDFRSRVAALE